MKKTNNLGREIHIGESKILQMDVLSAVDEFCRSNNIRYSMSNGTMLGAIRHKGYIPWDDDIDIYILREEYDKLMSIFPKVYKGRYCIKSLERSDKWDFPFAKAYDNRTVVIEEASYNELFGVNIDIFPIDDVPDDNNLWMVYDQRRRKLYNKGMFLYRLIPFSLKPYYLIRWLFWGGRKLFYNRRKYAESVNKYAQKWRGKGYNYVFECCQGIFQKNRFRKDLFYEIKDYPFEDRFFKGFSDYDEYLRNGFGDYMKLPPEEKRVSHHSNKAYWIKQ